MSDYYDLLLEDVRFVEGMKSCMNCGVCTGVCPAAEFYSYDPRTIVSIVQRKDDNEIEALLKGEEIWYCGECMSCKPRCPRGNVPALVIQSLRLLSQKLGFFVLSEKGRQQLAIKRTIGENVYSVGYCVTPDLVTLDEHPEQGLMWQWVYKNTKDVFDRFDNDYGKLNGGACRKMDDQTLQEIQNIFEVSGGKEMYDIIEKYSDEYALSQGYNGADQDYMTEIFSVNSQKHYE